MKNTKLAVLVVAIVLAAGSFLYGRHRYMQKNSVVLTNPFNASETQRITNPTADPNLFGDWIKSEMAFAVVIPLVLLGFGVAFAVKK
jgi:hypothetical protein